MDVYDAIAARRSVRRFKEQRIPRGVLKRILLAGTQAPTARNEQGHRTLAVTDPAIIRQLVPGQGHVGTAPCVLAVYFDGEDRLMACGQPARAMDCAICLSYMSLAALEHGIQGCWLGGFDADRVKALLGLPASATVVAMHTLGYPDGEAARPGKKDPASLLEYR